MRYLSIGLVGMLVLACRTHQQDGCFPECDQLDQAWFASCVANGDVEVDCLAGNRACCALAAGCLGMLDDQEVVSGQATCTELIVDTCWPSCTDEDRDDYRLCLEGGTSCGVDNPRCCAELSACLGGMVDYVVEPLSGLVCCDGPEDCPEGQACLGGMWMCVPGSSGCGDGVMSGAEECDDGGANDVCEYGLTDCIVCGPTCTHVAGETSFCGDGEIDAEFETCDPPGAACDAECQETLPVHCFDTAVSGDETDFNCGGSCDPCAPDQRCLVDEDCSVLTDMCGAVPSCSGPVSMGVCIELFDCDDGDPCTLDTCDTDRGCVHPPLDDDGDGHGPESLGCGADCDDLDSRADPDNTSEIICNGVDDDCDVRTLDEPGTTC